MPISLLIREASRILWHQKLITVFSVAVTGAAICFWTLLASFYLALSCTEVAAHHPDRLFFLQVRRADGGIERFFSVPEYERFRQVHPSEGLSAFARFQVQAAVQGSVGLARVTFVSDNFLPKFQVRPAHGTLDLLRAGAVPAAVISDRFWRERWQSRPDVVGRPMEVNGQPCIVAAVLPKGFSELSFGLPSDLYLPLTMAGAVMANPRLFGDPNVRWLNPVVELGDGARPAAAQASLHRTYLAQRAQEISSTGRSLVLLSARFGETSHLRQLESQVLLLNVVAALLQVISLCTIVSLFVATDLDRIRDVATRMALGGGWQDLAALLLVRAMLVALLSVLAGLGLTSVIYEYSVGVLAPEDALAELTVPRTRVEALAVIFTVIVATLTASSAAFYFQFVRRFGLAEVMRSGFLDAGRSTGLRWQQTVAAVQVGGAALLVFGAGLLLTHHQRLRQVQLNMDVSNLGVVQASIGPERIRGLVQELAQEALVQKVSCANLMPLGSDSSSMTVQLPGHNDYVLSETYFVCPALAATLGVPILEGRDFHQVPMSAPREPEALVNQTLARSLFGPTSAVGRKVRLASGETATIVGVIRDLKYRSLQDRSRPGLFLRIDQFAKPALFIYVRASSTQLQAALPVLAGRITSASGRDAVIRHFPFQAHVERLLAPVRLVGLTLALVAGFGVALSLLCSYCATATFVALKKRDIVVRLALGATPSDIARFLVRRLGASVLTGLLVGLAVSMAGAILLHWKGVPLPVGQVSLFTAVFIASATTATSAHVVRKAATMRPTDILREQT